MILHVNFRNRIIFIISYLSRAVHCLWFILFPAGYAKYFHKITYGEHLDLKTPKDFKEKIAWLKVYSDLAPWTSAADKYLVRKYVEECGLGHILVKLYGVWKDAREIDFNILPEKFVLKTNNGCGTNLLVYDKAKLDINSTVNLLNKWIKKRQGLISFEPHLWNIERRIIAEELLEDKQYSNISASLIDYKFFCFHGEPNFIDVLYDRKNKVVGADRKPSGSDTRENVYDLEWNIIANALTKNSPYDNLPVISRPDCLDEMISLCRILSKPFPQVRVDLYVVNDMIYFGELTFTSGKMEEFSPELLMKMGDKIDLSLARKRTRLFIV